MGLAVALLLFEKRNPMKAATFLGLDPRNAYDEYYCSKYFIFFLKNTYF